MLLLSLVALCALLQFANAGCATPKFVNDTYTADPPAFNAGSSGFLANDVLTLLFHWASYGASNRTIDSAHSGFVSSTNVSKLCSSHLLSSAEGTVTLNTAGCDDTAQHDVPWSTAKTDCGSEFFVSSSVGTPILYYDVTFRYRITYLEVLSNQDTRTVQSDFMFMVSTPTEFTVNSTLFNLQGTTTFISRQTVTSDTTGAINVTVTVVTDCTTTLAVTNVAAVGTPGATIGTHSTPVKNNSPITGTGTQFDGLCRSTFVVPLTPITQTVAQCNINGLYNFSYTLTFADASTWDTSAVVQLTSTDTCSTITIMSNPPTFSLSLYRQSDQTGGVLTTGSTVSYQSRGHWQLVLTPPTINSAPTPDLFTTETIAWSSDGTTWNNASSLGAISFVDSGNSFPANNYNFSFIWDPSVFTSSGLVYIRLTFYITYPATTTGTNTKKRFEVVNIVPVEEAVRRLQETTQTHTGYIQAHQSMQLPQIAPSAKMMHRQSLNMRNEAVSKPYILASSTSSPASTSAGATTPAVTAGATTAAATGTDTTVIIGAVVGAIGGAVVVSLSVVGIVWWRRSKAAASVSSSAASSPGAENGVQFI